MIDNNINIKTTYSPEINILTVKNDCKVEDNLSNESTVSMLKTAEQSWPGNLNLGMGGVNPSQLRQMMSYPQYQQTMNAVLNNPILLNQILILPKFVLY